MVIIKRKELKKTKVYDTYWKFANERQNIFIRKFEGEENNLTEDKILQEYKFTNAYRASDRVSQYLIRNIIYQNGYSEEDIIFRILLFKTFNNIDTWKKLENILGKIVYNEYDIERYGKLLNDYYMKGEKLYSGAYIMASGKTAFGQERKFMNHLMLIDYMMKNHITKKIMHCRNLEELYNTLLAYPTIGTFLAYQYAVDINYSELVNFDEMEFVVAGPGAKAGIRKSFSNSDEYSQEYIIRYMCEHQEEEFQRLGLKFSTLGGRKLQLIDCQNIFCETDKYSRVKHPDIIDRDGRTRIKQKYRINKEKINYFYPPKWGINNKMTKGLWE